MCIFPFVFPIAYFHNMITLHTLKFHLLDFAIHFVTKLSHLSKEGNRKTGSRTTSKALQTHTTS